MEEGYAEMLSHWYFLITVQSDSDCRLGFDGSYCLESPQQERDWRIYQLLTLSGRVLKAGIRCIAEETSTDIEGIKLNWLGHNGAMIDIFSVKKEETKK